MTGIAAADRQFQGSAGLMLAATTWGDEGNPPVLLLHGAGQSRHAWRHTARALAEVGRYAIAVDHRGHGDSDWPELADYEFSHYADDVERLLQQLPGPPVVIGASLGGIAALVAQGRSSEQRYEALVLVDVTPAMQFSGVRRVLGFMAAHPDGFESLEQASALIADYTGRPRPATPEGLRSVLRPDAETRRWRWHWDARFLDGKLHVLDNANGEQRAEQVRRELEAAAAKVRMPTLVVRGEQSDLVTPEAVRALVDIIPGAQYVDVADAGHMVAGDDNDRFTAAVLRFLGGYVPRA
jgi:pimeloyl-ACP methyl ester carboxylesterase